MAALTNVSPEIQQMMTAVPGFEIGDKVHACYVNKLEGALPGHFSQMIGTGKAFRSIFFKNWKADPLYNDVSAKTGLNDGWWSNFSVAVLCQSIDHVTHQLAKQMVASKIDGAVNANNNGLRANSAHFYATALANYFPQFTNLYNKVDHASAKNDYIKGLVDNVSTHQLWYTAGQWKNPDWELFHHYAKLIALGASDAEIDQLVDKLSGLGLPIPPTVNKQNWRSYSVYLQNKPNVDHSDIDSTASGPMLASIMPQPVGRGIPMPIPEGNSYEFTANGQPGSPYRSVPSGSCFSAQSQVLMADGTAKPIVAVQAGDKVATPNGPSAVAMVAAALVNNRQLYSINGTACAFSATHPFCNAAHRSGDQDSPQYLSISPEVLKHRVPTLSLTGIGKLAPGQKVTGLRKLDSPAEVIVVNDISPAPAVDKSNLFIYDLIFAPEENGSGSYYIGSDGLFFLAHSEMPVMERALHGTAVIMEILKQALPEFETKANNGSAADFGKQLSGYITALDWFQGAALTAALFEAAKAGRTPANLRGTQVEPLALKSVGEYMQWFTGMDEKATATLSAVFEMLTSGLVYEIESLVQNGWRHFPETAGDTYALSVLDFHLNADHPLKSDRDLRVRVKFFDGENEKESHDLYDNLGRANTSFVRYFDRVIYLDTKVSEGTEPRRLVFEFYLAGGAIPVLVAEAYLPEKFEIPYRMFSPKVRGADGTDHGHVYFDLRLISQSAVGDEVNQSLFWTEESKWQYTYALGEALAGKIKTLVSQWSPPAAAETVGT